MADALDLLARNELDVALVDEFVDGESGLALAARLHRASPTLRVILTVAEPVPSSAVLAHRGVYACVARTEDARGLVEVIERVAMGARLAVPASPVELSAREHEVLRGIASGLTNAQIAEAMSLSVNTVKDHTRAVYRKLQARNRADAILRAQRLGLMA